MNPSPEPPLQTGPDPSDRELWRLAATEPDAFGILFDRHGATVHAYCARRCGSSDVADDLTSIVFLESWRRRGEVDLYDDSALPWLLGVANRVMRHRWRTTVRHRAALARLPRAAVFPDHADEAVARLDDEAHLARVHRAVRRLSAADQEVLALCVWQGLDYASASVALGVPIGTVRSRLSRARSRLQALSVDPDPPPGRAPDPAPVPPARTPALSPAQELS
jgi:RNA polymerase sigma factor (sigma-70 family)